MGMEAESLSMDADNDSARTCLEIAVLPGGDGVQRLTLAGEIDLSTANQVREHLAAITDGGGERIELDLGGIGYCDSTGLHVLNEARLLCVGRSGWLRVVNPSDQVARLLEVSGLAGELLAAPPGLAHDG